MQRVGGDVGHFGHCECAVNARFDCLPCDHHICAECRLLTCPSRFELRAFRQWLAASADRRAFRAARREALQHEAREQRAGRQSRAHTCRTRLLAEAEPVPGGVLLLMSALHRHVRTFMEPQGLQELALLQEQSALFLFENVYCIGIIALCRRTIFAYFSFTYLNIFTCSYIKLTIHSTHVVCTRT